MTEEPLARTPLHNLHVSLGARFTPFAGYQMPVQYPSGIIAEHLHTRAQASLFDVSHMGQVILTGTDIPARFERLVPSDITGLRPGRMRYTVLTNEHGGIVDDLIVARDGDSLRLVVNAACKATDLAYLRLRLGERDVVCLQEYALLALQGPAAAAVMARFDADIAMLPFMGWATANIDGVACRVARSGYTGEDGFEISVPDASAEKIAQRLLAQPEVLPAGLGARDSLRLEAGLCLYGADIDADTSPIEADLAWVVAARRRQSGDFPGSDIILQQLAMTTRRRRVGIRPVGRQIARSHTSIVDAQGAEIGLITSGGYSPTLKGPVAMGYVPTDLAQPGTRVGLSLRGAVQQAEIVQLPFVPHRYYLSPRRSP